MKTLGVIICVADTHIMLPAVPLASIFFVMSFRVWASNVKILNTTFYYTTYTNAILKKCS